MSSHYQSLSLCNESFLVFWSKRRTNPHLSQPSVSDSASYNLDLNPCPLGPQNSAELLDLPCNSTGHSHTEGLRTPSAHFNCTPKTFMTTVRHSVSKPGFAWSPGTGSLDGGTGSAGVGGFWRLIAFTTTPSSHPANKTYGLCYYVAGQCLIARAQQEPSFALSV